MNTNELVALALLAGAVVYALLPPRPRSRVSAFATLRERERPGETLLDALDACKRTAAADEIERRLGRSHAAATLAGLVADLAGDGPKAPGA